MARVPGPAKKYSRGVTSQPGNGHDLHGSAPDTHYTALLLIDVINDFEFPRGEDLFSQVLPLAPHIAALKRRASAAGVPVIYVNDNFGKWHSNFDHTLRHCLNDGVRGKPFVQQLLPGKDDYFVLKPKHSGFYQTPLEILLKHLGTRRLILTGVSTNSCILFTAGDAYMRDLELVVPRDCVAACSPDEHEFASAQMRTMMKADISPAAAVRFDFQKVIPA